MKIFIVAVLMAVASQVQAFKAGDVITSVCRFGSAEGDGEAHFSVKYLEMPNSRGGVQPFVFSTLTIAGRVVPAKHESCRGLPRRGLRCTHADEGGSYDLVPAIAPTEKVENTRLLRLLDGDRVKILTNTAVCQ